MSGLPAQKPKASNFLRDLRSERLVSHKETVISALCFLDLRNLAKDKFSKLSLWEKNEGFEIFGKIENDGSRHFRISFMETETHQLKIKKLHLLSRKVRLEQSDISCRSLQ